jgi:hypothetical protein
VVEEEIVVGFVGIGVVVAVVVEGEVVSAGNPKVSGSSSKLPFLVYLQTYV